VICLRLTAERLAYGLQDEASLEVMPGGQSARRFRKQYYSYRKVFRQ
jgi:hypothetical protein